MVNLNTAIQFLDPTESQATCLKLTAMHLYFEDLKNTINKAISENGSANILPIRSVTDFGFATFGDFIREIGVFLECDDDIVYRAMDIFGKNRLFEDQRLDFLEKIKLIDMKIVAIRDVIDQCLPKQEFVDSNSKKIGER